MTEPVRLTDQRPRQLDELLAAGAPLILPVGTIEWHSHHLPVGLDGLVAEGIAKQVAALCGGVLAPTSWWAAGGVQFPHTVRLEGTLIASLMDAALLEYARLGFRVVLVVNGHFGLEHSLVSRLSALKCMGETDATVLVVAPYEVLTDLGNHGDHAGTWETALLWALHENLVDARALGSDGELPGIIGDDPRGSASRQLGIEALATAATRLAEMVNRVAHDDAEARTSYRHAIESASAALEALFTLRATRPRHEVPPVATPAWRRHLEALVAGRYQDAGEFADLKRRDPAA